MEETRDAPITDRDGNDIVHLLPEFCAAGGLCPARASLTRLVQARLVQAFLAPSRRT
jgi:hypothetical protein